MHLQDLAEMGIDVAQAQSCGQLDLRPNTEVYLPDGTFDADRMYETFEAFATDRRGYALSRIVCDMNWATERPPLFEELIRFEARVNEVWNRHDDVVICSYDVNMLTGDMVIDIMRTHPLVLIGCLLQANPFFVAPEQFLRERAKRSHASWPVS